jgi:LVIVD repeat
MKKLLGIGLMVVAILLAASCKEETTGKVGKVMAYKPLYSSDANIYSIQNKPPQHVTKAGKIYARGNYIFQNEIGLGIHIIDNSNPANAQRIGFIQIAGSEEISIKGNYLYSNNFSDLVVVDISNIKNAVEVNRIKNAFFSSSTLARPPRRGYFECVDNSKGVVTGWIQDSIENPTCQN